MDKKAVGERIKQAREALKITQVVLAERAEREKPADKRGNPSPRGLQDNEAGKSAPGSEMISALVESGANANWILTGKGEMLLADIVFRKPYDWSNSEHVVSESAPPPYGFVLVPRYDVAASMGSGSVIHSEQVVDHLAFREEWVRTELSTNPNNLVLISAIGDSMEPTLRAGDLLLVDRSAAGVVQDAIYAFATNSELRVKRMQLKIDGSVVVRSDNPQYEAELLSPDQVASLRIVGRVVWSGRRM
jgi:phage repressor protein C with HTH and peptisase S24 domain